MMNKFRTTEKIWLNYKLILGVKGITHKKRGDDT